MRSISTSLLKKKDTYSGKGAAAENVSVVLLVFALEDSRSEIDLFSMW